MPVGKPPINDPNDVEAIQAKIDAYFAECAAAERPTTFTGLAIALGYSSRTSLWERSKDKNILISEPIKAAMLRVECGYEEALRSASCTGSIFALKNRGWTDKSEIELSGSVKSSFEYVDPPKPDESTR